MEALKTFFVDLFSRSVSELSGLHFIILALITVLFFFLAKYILKCIWTALKAICRGIKNLCSTKKRCEKIQCPHCGRPEQLSFLARAKKEGFEIPDTITDYWPALHKE